MVTVYGYKDTASKVSFVVTGLILLIALNLWVVVWLQDQGYAIWLLVGILILAWVFWRMRRVYTKLHYTFDQDGITIHLPSGKEFRLNADEIDETEKIGRLPFYAGRGVKYLFWKNEFHFTTSSTNVLKITMKDGRVIVITPKEYPAREMLVN